MKQVDRLVDGQPLTLLVSLAFPYLAAISRADYLSKVHEQGSIADIPEVTEYLGSDSALK